MAVLIQILYQWHFSLPEEEVALALTVVLAHCHPNYGHTHQRPSEKCCGEKSGGLDKTYSCNNRWLVEEMSKSN